MLFNSIDFGVFLPVVFILYWFVFNKNLKIQNILLLLASYFFYSWWDWRFLALIIFSSTIDYLIGNKIENSKDENKRKQFLLFSLAINLGFLVFFKYFNFFIDSFHQAFTLFGEPFKVSRLNIILPIGISFYTFQTLSYSIDIYRRKMKASKDIVSFFSFVSFFPQLVAGPIERASNLLPQFYTKRSFNYYKAVDGLKQILWGLVKKVVIADNCAIIVNDIFANYTVYSGSTLILGAIFFAFQIYGDFSGYSDIAIGTARLFGFNLMQNFAFPYFSRDIAEFWRRWHISLSKWFRDYLYIPLGGSKGGKKKTIRNIFIIFIVSGFWHGANWTFIIWGALNAFYFIPLFLLKKNRNNLDIVAAGRTLPNLKETTSILLTFSLTIFAWIFFRAENISHALLFIEHIFTNFHLTFPSLLTISRGHILITIILLIIFIVIEWFGRDGEYAINKYTSKWNKKIKLLFYYTLIFLIIFFSEKSEDFIYFQF